MSMMDNKILVTFTVNGRQVEVLTAPNRTLLEVLREDLGLSVQNRVVMIQTVAYVRLLLIKKL